MKVQAIGKGVYGVMREIGDVFEIPSKELFSPVWMKEYVEPKPAVVEKPAPAVVKEEPEDKPKAKVGKR